MINRLFRAIVLLVVFVSNIQATFSNTDEFDNERLLNSLQCPTVLAQYSNDIGLCGANLTIDNPISTDPNCVIVSVFNNFNNSNNASGFYPVGVTTVVFTAVFTNGTSASCSVDINVADLQAPTLICPPVSPLICDISELPIITTLDDFLAAGGAALDNCGPLDTMSFAFVQDIVINPGNCPLLVEREYEIADANMQIATCRQMVTINDITPPMITCPSNITVNTSTCDAFVTVPLPATTDNCGIASTVNDYNNTADASDTYPIGTTQVVFTTTDNCGNTGFCFFNITVEENEAPTAVCQDITVELNGVGVGDFTADQIDNGSSDNCDMNLDLSIDVNTSGCTDVGSPITVTLTVTDDSGNTDTCTATVTVQDNEDPSITCPPNFTNECDNISAPYVDLAAFIADGGLASDNCSITGFALALETSSAGVCPVTEILSRTYIITDASGNTATCIQTVTVEDNTSPVITTSASDMTVECDGGGNTTDLNSWLNSNAGAVAQDACQSVMWTNDFSGLSDLCGETGSASVIFTATDDCGNISTTSASFTIEDTSNPLITTQAMDMTVQCDGAGNTTALNDWLSNNAGAVASDGCSGSLITWTNDFTSLSDLCGATGTTLVVFTATDDCGNTNSTSANFTIEDTTNPVLVGVPTSITDIECDASFPQFTVTATDICGNAFITTDTIYDDTQLCVVPLGYSVFYIWTATDDCGNTSSEVVSFNVLEDMTPPVLNCITPIELRNSAGECAYIGTIDPPTFSDDCSSVSLSNSMTGTMPLTGTFPVGAPINVVWTATDDCGNSSTCEQVINVVDNEAPACVVADSSDEIALDGNGEATYSISSLDIDLTDQDNCPGTLTAFILRMDDSCNNPDNLIEGNEITVCCADVGVLNIIVRVYDEAMNSNECMVNLTVSDNLVPQITNPLPNVNIPCSFEYDDLSAFGTYVEDAMDVMNYSIPQPLPSTSTTDFTDGLVSDACGIDSIATSFTDNRDDCGRGTIVRFFEVYDNSGNSATDQQIITVINDDPFDETDITWPADFTITSGCVTAPPPSSLTGEPVISLKPCSMVGPSSSDEFFDDPNSGCPLIRRTWRIIDWCQYVSNSGSTDGIWEHVQFIYVENDIAPVLVCPDSMEVCTNEVTCRGIMNFSIEATDDCTDSEDIDYSYAVDVDNDGSIDFTGIGDSIPGIFDRGVYRIDWTADDQCGNRDFCSTVVTVRDCKSPLAVCMTGISIDLNEMPQMGIVAMIWASDFNVGSSDNCTDSDNLIYSFSSDTDSTQMILTCDDIGSNPIEMWVTDEDGNQSFCRASVIVQDNKSLCPQPSTRISISGRVHNYMEEQLEDVEMKLEYDEQVVVENTDENGSYAFDDLEMYHDYKVKPSYDDDPLNGVSTLDLVMIQRHILGLQDLDSPYKIIAADANGSNSVDAIDLITIRKLILGIFKDFNGTSSWRFVDGNQEYADNKQPWDYIEYMNMFDLDYDAKDMDFVGIKTADVNGTAEVNSVEQHVEKRWNTKELFLVQEGEYSSIRINDGIDISGFQLRLNHSGIAVEIESDLDSWSSDNYQIEDGQITISWNGAQATNLLDGAELFRIKSRGLVDLDQSYFNSEIYDNALNVYNINLSSRSFELEDLDQILKITVAPNPFKEETQISLFLPSDGDVHMEFYDATGKLLSNSRISMQTGINQFQFGDFQLGSYRGLIYFRVKYKESVQTKRIIKL